MLQIVQIILRFVEEGSAGTDRQVEGDPNSKQNQPAN